MTAVRAAGYTSSLTRGEFSHKQKLSWFLLSGDQGVFLNLLALIFYTAGTVKVIDLVFIRSRRP